MMGRRQILKSGLEEDWVTSWRHVFSWKPGMGRWVKRSLNKRYRRQIKKETLDELFEVKEVCANFWKG